jgi:hypothetical protein
VSCITKILTEPEHQQPDLAFDLFRSLRSPMNLAFLAWLRTNPDPNVIALEVDGTVAVVRQLAVLARAGRTNSARFAIGELWADAYYLTDTELVWLAHGSADASDATSAAVEALQRVVGARKAQREGRLRQLRHSQLIARLMRLGLNIGRAA